MVAETKKSKNTKKENRYFEAIGRRKSATARVRLTPSKKTTDIKVNDRPFTTYFRHAATQKTVQSILNLKEAGIGNYDISVHIKGGGLSAQADAIKLGIARALVKEDEDRRGVLKPLDFLKRDPRSVERKKFGLRKARRRPQWSKR